VEKRIPKFFNKGKKERLEGIQKNIRWEDKFSLISPDKKKKIGSGLSIVLWFGPIPTTKKRKRKNQVQ
jgi:hypothetical protein